MKKIFNLVAALMLLATGASAQSTWNPKFANTNNWNSITNWQGGVPGANTDAIIPTGQLCYPVLTATGNCRSLSIAAGTGSFNPSVTVPYGGGTTPITLNINLNNNATTGLTISTGTNPGKLTIEGLVTLKGNIVNNGVIGSGPQRVLSSEI